MWIKFQQIRYNWWAVTSLLVIRIWVISWWTRSHTNLIKTEVDAYIPAAYCYELLISIYSLTDNETFNLWETSNFFAPDTEQD